MFFSLSSIKKPRKQFNLLHLETSEHYFLSLKVSLHTSIKHEEIRGKLHLCSRSIVFEPKQIRLPLIKMKYSNNLLLKVLKNFDMKSLMTVLQIKWDPSLIQEDVDNLDLQQILQFQKGSDREKQNELLEKLYHPNKPAQKKPPGPTLLTVNAFFIKVDKLFVVNRNPISPYITETSDDNLLFSISKSNSKQNVIRFLKLFQGINLAEDETNYISAIISTTLSEGIAEYKQQASTQGQKLDLVLKCRQIKTEGTVYGIFTIQKEDSISFIPLLNSPKGSVLNFSFTDVKFILKYRYMFKQLGTEVWLFNKPRSYLFVFEDPQAQDMVYKTFTKRCTKHCLNQINLQKCTDQWQNGQLSNYDYLMALNVFANRSFNDLSAYPVYPWVVQEYNEKEFAVHSAHFFRDLSKPIGALNKHRLQKYKAFYQDQIRDKSKSIPPYLYPTHYSSPGTVVYYLIRKIPEFVIKLQNGVFGPTDRIFRGIDSTWYTTLNLHADSKELIPEFYSLDSDFLINCDKLELGVTQEGEIIDDAVLPSWASSFSDFLIKMRIALESDFVSANLPKWIDLIFGVKSRGGEAIECDNLFYPYTYAENVDWGKCRTSIEKQALETQVAEFGQVPAQLFQNQHVQRKLKIQPALKQLEDEKKDLKQQNNLLVQKNQRLAQQLESNSDVDAVLALQKQVSALQWENEKLKFQLDYPQNDANNRNEQKLETFNSQFDQEEIEKIGQEFFNDDSLLEEKTQQKNQGGKHKFNL